MTLNEIDRVVARPNRWVMALFWRPIRTIVRRFINRAYERGIINSNVLHLLHEMADRIYTPETAQ